MAHAVTAAELFHELRQLPNSERQKFFVLLANQVFQGEDLSHEAVFGHLADNEFTAAEASEYLEISLSTFRRLVASQKLQPSSSVGRSQLFAVPALKAFKKAMRATKA